MRIDDIADECIIKPNNIKSEPIAARQASTDTLKTRLNPAVDYYILPSNADIKIESTSETEGHHSPSPERPFAPFSELSQSDMDLAASAADRSLRETSEPSANINRAFSKQETPASPSFNLAPNLFPRLLPHQAHRFPLSKADNHLHQHPLNLAMADYKFENGNANESSGRDPENEEMSQAMDGSSANSLRLNARSSKIDKLPKRKSRRMRTSLLRDAKCDAIFNTTPNSVSHWGPQFSPSQSSHVSFGDPNAKCVVAAAATHDPRVDIDHIEYDVNCTNRIPRRYSDDRWRESGDPNLGLHQPHHQVYGRPTFNMTTMTTETDASPHDPCKNASKMLPNTMHQHPPQFSSVWEQSRQAVPLLEMRHPVKISRDQVQATLEIEGDLADMTRNWSLSEIKSGRRLVKFYRYQYGVSIFLGFEPICPKDYRENMCVISCIWRRETQEYFLTSVDCIVLLELVINQKFSIEEKNRIRRNLEVCKPITVSKTKRELESFFRQIMEFAQPRPRHIEKDVKVFLWGNLDNALRKIVSKYSASWNALNNSW